MRAAADAKTERRQRRRDEQAEVEKVLYLVDPPQQDASAADSDLDTASELVGMYRQLKENLRTAGPQYSPAITREMRAVLHDLQVGASGSEISAADLIREAINDS